MTLVNCLTPFQPQGGKRRSTFGESGKVLFLFYFYAAKIVLNPKIMVLSVSFLELLTGLESGAKGTGICCAAAGGYTYWSISSLR